MYPPLHQKVPLTPTLAGFVLALAALGGAGCKKGEKPVPKPPAVDLRPLTPDAIQGWTARDAGRHFDPESVFQALNGGAEVYLDYGFRRLLLREYERPGRPRLTLHLFDLGTSAEAFGIFSHEREGKAVAVGTEADYGEGLLRFWRGRYFASLHATRETGPVREALLALGREIASRIPTAGRRPPLVGLLPPEGQRPGTLRYVHTAPTLDHHVRLGTANPLGLTKRTAVALADYGEGTSRLQGLVARYPAAALAVRGSAALAARREPPPTLSRACGNLLLAVVGGADATARRALLERLVARAPACKR